MDPDVINQITTSMRGAWGNPSSNHIFGQKAKDAIEKARKQTATAIGNRNKLFHYFERSNIDKSH